MQLLKPEFERADERGKLIQLITRNFQQLNLLRIKKNRWFGGHFHKIKEEFFYIVRGRVIVEIRDYQNKNKKRHTLKEGDCFLVECYDKHTIKALSNSLIIETLSEPYSENDVYR